MGTFMARADAGTNGSNVSARQLLFVVATLASAFLIFLVQPMVAKRILPWFGGVPSVWMLCLAFYQTTLFFGYAYAFLLIRFATPTLQLVVHAVLVCSALVVLPVLPDDIWKPTGATSPSLYIFQMLASNVALPFLVLASTGPLVQAWFARCYPERSPYPLYAVSNIGSFAALLAYPFLLEPRLPLSATGTVWSYAFAITAAGVLCCAAAVRFRPLEARASGFGASEILGDSEDGSKRLDATHVSLWFLLSGCAVVLLMGATNLVCLDVASVPFLWIIPLATYLLTFVLCFASERVYRPIPYLIITLISLVPTLGLYILSDWGAAPLGGLVRSVYVQIPGYCGLVFGGCMIMHGELYRLRPPPRELTAFYMCVSGGGALGGLFVGLLAPVLFDGYYEVRVGIGLAALLFLAATALWANAPGRGGVHGWRWTVVAPLGIVLLSYALWNADRSQDGVIYQERSFFGVLRVDEVQSGVVPQRHLSNGSTLHGVQFRTLPGSRMPSSYYGKATGVGLALAQRGGYGPMKVGVIGLGIGTLSAYGREGDLFHFYEINPAVLRIARDTGYFSYLEDSRAEVEVVVGDARLAIADEQARNGSQEYDYLIVDAFSSDAIPVHLLTLEAFRYYVASMAPSGIIAVHVSNRHFDLMPLVARVGFEVGLQTLYVRSGRVPQFQSGAAHWALMSSDPHRLRALAKNMRRGVASMGLPARHLKMSQSYEVEVQHVALWSDDYSDLLGALRLK